MIFFSFTAIEEVGMVVWREGGRKGGVSERERETDRQRDTSVMKLCSLAQIYAAFLGQLSAGGHGESQLGWIR